MTKHIVSNFIDVCNVSSLADPLNTGSEGQFILMQNVDPNEFVIKPNYIIQVIVKKRSTMTFENGNTYNLDDALFSCFTTNIQKQKTQIFGQ